MTSGDNSVEHIARHLDPSNYGAHKDKCRCRDAGSVPQYVAILTLKVIKEAIAAVTVHVRK